LADAVFQFDAALVFGQVARHINNVRGRDKAAQMVELYSQPTLVVANHFVRGDLSAVHQLLGAYPISLLEGVRHAQDKDAIVVRLFADDNIDRLSFAQILHKLWVKPRQIRLGYDAIAFAAHIDQQFRGSDLNDHPFTQIPATRQIQV